MVVTIYDRLQSDPDDKRALLYLDHLDSALAGQRVFDRVFCPSVTDSSWPSKLPTGHPGICTALR